jgi:hypothetical protein
VRANKRRADVCTKPPLEVVAPILAVDSDGSALGRCARALRSGVALGSDNARAGLRRSAIALGVADSTNDAAK